MIQIRYLILVCLCFTLPCTFTKNLTHHLVCTLQKTTMKNPTKKNIIQAIHDATARIEEICKVADTGHHKENKHYPHQKNKVFFIHFHHQFHQNWTIYKPSAISYKKFKKIAQKIYLEHGLVVNCHQDEIISIQSLKQDDEKSLHKNYITLEQLEAYKLNHANFDNDPVKKYLFWHAQIPTTGLMKSEQFDIPDAYKPIAWQFKLWDLAPNKGKGAKVAIIDTGVCAFSLNEKPFADLYKKNINISCYEELNDYGYNLVSLHGLDPIQQIVMQIAQHCNHQKFKTSLLMEKLPEWIIEFIETKNQVHFEQFLIEHAKNELLDDSKLILNKKGDQVLKDLLYGDHGICPKNAPPFFHIAQLKEPKSEKILIETLPAPKIGTNNALSAGHGTFTQGIVNAQLHNNQGIEGIAPLAQVTMIKAFHDSGTTNKTTLNAALQRAIMLDNPIVSMSLKITDEFDQEKDAHLKELIDSIDYVIAASGNDGMNKKLKNKEAYPAKFDSVAFDVGAFSYDDGKYPVCPFTQTESQVGPKFVAPGYNLFSSGLIPNQTQDSMYLFMSGTSIAVPVITGFMALVLGEFQELLTREQILKIIYAGSMKLSEDSSWKNIHLGTPDMRSCLLCCHVMTALQKKLKERTDYSFEEYFDQLVAAVYCCNYAQPTTYEKKFNTSFRYNFSGYIQALQNEKATTLSSTQSYSSVADAVESIVSTILSCIDNRNELNLSSDRNEAIIKIIQNKSYELFKDRSKFTQKRISQAYASRSTSIILE